MNHMLDGRTKEDVTEQVRELSAVRTPEWKFDTEHPDAGTALALLFAEMLADTIKRYNRIPQKHCLSFFGKMGLRIQPAVPAEGVVTFSLSTDEFGGVMVPKGTTVLGEEASFETTEAVCVTPAKIRQILFVDGKNDYIGKKSPKHAFLPFLGEEENLQEHVFYLKQDDVFSVSGDAKIYLGLTPWGGMEREDAMEWLLDEEEISISYGTEDGFEEFSGRSVEQGRLVLNRKEGQPEICPKDLFGEEGLWICCRALRPWTRDPYIVEDIRLLAQRSGIKPDLIWNEIGEQTKEEIYLFGEEPALFGECYFASAEALSKPGAKIRLSFELDYEKRPFDNSYQIPREWKLLMKRSDFTPDPVYDITIEQICFEYYNGSGWSRIFKGDEYQHIFNGCGGAAVRQVVIEFICPQDAALLEWQAGPTRYIRVRILKMKNMFREKGEYIVPVIHNVRFAYEYTGSGVWPEYAAVRNNRKETLLPVRLPEGIPGHLELFSGITGKRRMFCLGFHLPPSGGPVRIFFSMEDETGENMPKLCFEYSRKDGAGPLSVTDGTKAFQRNGIISFMGPEDWARQTVFGECAYWLFVIDEGDGYRKLKAGQCEPVIRGIFPNTVGVIARKHKPAEYFSIEAGEKNKALHLRNQDIGELSVWVREEGKWVKWEETEDFFCSKETDRHYIADRIRGSVQFSDGVHGAIPPAGETIRVEYSFGGGTRGNLPSGAINRLGGTFSYVNGVFNPLPVCGGYDREDEKEALARGKAWMRHRGRAVTAGDYEALAKEASRLVQRAKCYTNYNARGIYEPGSITLVLLLKEYRAGKMQSVGVKKAVYEYISGRMDGNLKAMGHLYIIEPEFLVISCRVEAVARDVPDVFQVKESIRSRLLEFLDPVTGNYDGNGWEIGILPNETQITNALKGILDAAYIRELRMSVYRIVGQRLIQVQPEDLKGAAAFGKPGIRFAVGVSGENEIHVLPE